MLFAVNTVTDVSHQWGKRFDKLSVESSTNFGDMIGTHVRGREHVSCRVYDQRVEMFSGNCKVAQLKEELRKKGASLRGRKAEQSDVSSNSLAATSGSRLPHKIKTN